jgi:hypothetical protein
MAYVQILWLRLSDPMGPAGMQASYGPCEYDPRSLDERRKIFGGVGARDACNIGNKQETGVAAIKTRDWGSCDKNLAHHKLLAHLTTVPQITDIRASSCQAENKSLVSSLRLIL